MDKRELKLRFVYVEPLDKGDSLIWHDGCVIPHDDDEARAADYGKVRTTYDGAAKHQSRDGTWWARNRGALLVETSLDQNDVFGRPLACTVEFEGLPDRGRATLPAVDVLQVLKARNYGVDEARLRRTLRRAAHQRSAFGPKTWIIACLLSAAAFAGWKSWSLPPKRVRR
jgi:hypothetical protein